MLLKIKEAEELLLKAEKLGKKRGYRDLVEQIENEYYQLINQMSIWKEYLEHNASLLERIELAQLESMVVKLVNKKVEEIPEGLIEKKSNIKAYKTYLEELSSMNILPENIRDKLRSDK